MNPAESSQLDALHRDLNDHRREMAEERGQLIQALATLTSAILRLDSRLAGKHPKLNGKFPSMPDIMEGFPDEEEMSTGMHKMYATFRDAQAVAAWRRSAMWWAIGTLTVISLALGILALIHKG